MKKEVDLYYCFPMANNWEIYFNSAFYSADKLLYDNDIHKSFEI